MTKGKKTDDSHESHLQNEEPVIKKSKKKKKKKRKSESHLELTSDSPREEPKNVNPDNSGKQKRKKKKRKRKPEEDGGKSSARKKKKSKVKQDDNDSSNELPRSSPLEGHMMDDTMVLLDRKAGKVFSSDRKEIGSILKDGKITLQNRGATEENGEETSAADFPFETDADDHCESPLDAYTDIVPFLRDCATRSGTSQENMLIYDPYFCNGTVVRNLASLGFTNVYNKKEDAYAVWNTSNYPKHDILVTNPPYSGDHIELLIDHVTSKSFGNRPFLLLLPQWVHKKDYYLAKTKGIRPFYVVPHKRYVYLPPPSFRETKKSDVHKKSSPFVSMWFIWGGTTEQNERWLSAIARRISNCDVARSKSALRDLRRKGGGRNKK